MSIILSDDGTLDTVLRCTECGEEMRYTHMPEDIPAGEEEQAYKEWQEWIIEDASAEHVCPSEPTEPEER